MITPLRILFIALAAAVGIGLTAASVLVTWDLIQLSSTVVEEPSAAEQPDGSAVITVPQAGSDAPPFSFSSYGYAPVIAVIVILSGVAALRHRWEALALTCWFMLGGAVLEPLYMVWLRARHGEVPESIALVFFVGWALFPILGLFLAALAKARQELPSGACPSISMQERIRLRNTLIGVAAVSYLWRAIVVVFNPGMTFAIAYLRRMTDPYGPEQVVLSGVVGLGAAFVLLLCVVSSSRVSDRIMHAGLAFTAGFAFEGFLDTLDYAFWFGAPRELTHSLQDAVAFVACGAALALSLRTERSASPRTAPL